MDCGNGGHHKNNNQVKISRMTITSCGIFLLADIGKSNSAGTNVGADGTA